MKPCRQNRKALAWLAASVLEGSRAHELREHIKSCQGCADYYHQMRQVSDRLLAGAVEPAIDMPRSLHSRTLQALENEARGNWWEQFLPLPRWGVAAFSLALVLGIGASLFVWSPHRSSTETPRKVATAKPETTLAPTMSNYQMVANQSVEELDELLTRQANRHGEAAPAYTASSLAGVN